MLRGKTSFSSTRVPSPKEDISASLRVGVVCLWVILEISCAGTCRTMLCVVCVVFFVPRQFQHVGSRASSAHHGCFRFIRSLGWFVPPGALEIIRWWNMRFCRADRNKTGLEASFRPPPFSEHVGFASGNCNCINLSLTNTHPQPTHIYSWNAC